MGLLEEIDDVEEKEVEGWFIGPAKTIYTPFVIANDGQIEVTLAKALTASFKIRKTNLESTSIASHRAKRREN